MKAPMVTVLMPVYNGALHLCEAIDSILSQTMKDFEFLIVDDGSTDNSSSIIKSYNDNRINFIKNSNNLGLVYSLNRGISLASGEYIARMDADDISLPKRLELQIKAIQENNVDICGSWFQYHGQHDKRIIRHPENDVNIKIKLLFEVPFAHPTVVMKKKVARDLGYLSEWDKVEDYDLWVRAVKNNYKMMNVQEVLLKYRVHNNQVSEKHSREQHEKLKIIRSFYGDYFCSVNNIDQSIIKEAQKCLSVSSEAPDVDKIDAAFRELIKYGGVEARPLLYEQFTYLYLRVASKCKNPVKSWYKIYKECGTGWWVSTAVKLAALKLFKIDYCSRQYCEARKAYLYIFNK